MSLVVSMINLKPDTIFLEIMQHSAISKWIGGEVCQIKIEKEFSHFQEAVLRTNN